MPIDKNIDFAAEKQRAAQRMREMDARSKFKPASAGQSGKAGNMPPDFLGQTNIPFLKDLNLDSDVLLILGLVLVLSAEKSDKLLLLALLYILI